MKAEHEVTINDIKHRLAHVEQQEASLRNQRDTLYEQHQAVEKKLQVVQAERGELHRALKVISAIVTPIRTAQQEYDNHDRHNL